MAEGGFIGFARDAATEVHHDEPQGPPDGGIRSETAAQAPGLAVDVEGAGNRTIDHESGRAHVGRRLHPVQIKNLREHGLDPGDNHG